MFTVESLIEEISAATTLPTMEEQALAAKEVLIRAVQDHPDFLPSELLKPSEGHYSRWTIHTDPAGKFSILSMVWQPGQGTPLHDHGGLWVAEGIYSGALHILNYHYEGVIDGLDQFSLTEDRLDTAGMADHRVPPEEFHIVKNDQKVTAVSIHVFGGILNRYQYFEPVNGGYKSIEKVIG